MGFLNPQPEPADVEPFYARDYYGGREAKFGSTLAALRLAFARLRARRLARGLTPESRVLDVGCGDGELLVGFAALGHHGYGTEQLDTHPGPRLAGGGIEIRGGELADAGFPSDHFDLCVYWHSLEHLHDPRASLLEARRVLKPGGRLVVAVPNLDSFQGRWAGHLWFHLDLPRHLFHFTPRSLSALMSRTGFRVHRIGHYSLEQNTYGILQSVLNRWGGSRTRPNLLYEILKGTDGRDLPPSLRAAQRTAFVLGMPLAIPLACLESCLGRGGTIEAWATGEGPR
jgi:SAM-dependent methyltransferase